MTTKEALKRLKQPFNDDPDSYFDAKEVAMKSLEKDLSIIKELEKIKAEINFIAEKCLPNSLAEEYEVKGMKTTIEIIDKHIAELKGETE